MKAFNLAAAVTWISSTSVQAETMPAPGLYQVQVTLELPHVIDTNATKSERLCLGADASHAYGLRVMSDNNPLTKCPVTAVSLSADALAFDVACRGLNAEQGHAVYRVWGDRFEGRIAMKMGGKNMTMTEVQSGHRIGACEPNAGH